MLVLTRSIGESFRIGDDVEILVADTNGVAVKLGIEAPRDIKVNRKEVLERIASGSIKVPEGSYASKLTSNRGFVVWKQ